MSMHTLGILAQVITGISIIPYAIGIIKGVNKANRITWLIWMIIGILLWKTTEANPNSDETTILFSRILAFNPTLIFIISIIKGVNEPIQKSEIYAVIVATISIYFWWSTREEPNLIPTLLALIADACGLYPTLKFFYKNPKDERPIAWILFSIGSIIALIGVGSLDIEKYLLPLYMAIASIGLVVPLVKYRLKNNIPWRQWVGFLLYCGNYFQKKVIFTDHFF